MKAVAFTSAGDILAQAAADYPTAFRENGHVEALPENLWNVFARVCGEIGANTAADPVSGLAIVSHGETFIPLGRDAAAIGPAIMNADNRATDETKRLSDALGHAELYRITGVPPHPMYSIPKIMWLKRHNPSLYERASVFATPAGYLQARLGLSPAIDHSLAGRTLAFDLDAACWSRTILDAAGIEASKFPEAVAAGVTLGRLTQEAAEALNLPAGARVALGGHDQPCGALGAGCMHDGDAADSAGTYECLTVVSGKRPERAAASRSHLNTGRHVVGGLYATLAFFPAGVLTRWFLDELVPEEERRGFHAKAEDQVGRLGVDPTGICVLPHLVGACTPAWDPRATGVIVGLTPPAGRWHLYKAMFEGFACELDLNIEAVERALGSIHGVRIFGGNSRHAFSVQIRADVTGKRFEALANPETVCLGAAMLAGVAAGEFAGPAAAVATMTGGMKAFEPDPVTAAAYDKQKRSYRAVYPALEPVRDIEGGQ